MSYISSHADNNEKQSSEVNTWINRNQSINTYNIIFNFSLTGEHDGEKNRQRKNFWSEVRAAPFTQNPFTDTDDVKISVIFMLDLNIKANMVTVERNLLLYNNMQENYQETCVFNNGFQSVSGNNGDVETVCYCITTALIRTKYLIWFFCVSKPHRNLAKLLPHMVEKLVGRKKHHIFWSYKNHCCYFRPTIYPSHVESVSNCILSPRSERQ